MRAAVIYESMFGNTELIARAVGKGIGAEGAEVHLVDVREHEAYELTTYDVVVVGAPTHALTLSRPSSRRKAVEDGADPSHVQWGVREWLATLRPGARLPKVAVFDTKVRSMRLLPGSAAKAAARLLEQTGHEVVGRPTSFYVTAAKGPLADGEEDRAREWGAAIASELAHERLTEHQARPEQAQG